MTAVVILLSAAVGHAVAADAVLLAARHALVAASARTNETFPAKAAEILTAVSYTHLDVYKRQSSMW